MINKNKVNALVKAMRNCSALELSGGMFGESPYLDSLTWDGEATGKPDEQIVLITWTTRNGLEYSVILTEEGLSNAKVEENNIICMDHEGDEIAISLWNKVPMVIKID